MQNDAGDSLIQETLVPKQAKSTAFEVDVSSQPVESGSPLHNKQGSTDGPFLSLLLLALFWWVSTLARVHWSAKLPSPSHDFMGRACGKDILANHSYLYIPLTLDSNSLDSIENLDLTAPICVSQCPTVKHQLQQNTVRDIDAGLSNAYPESFLSTHVYRTQPFGDFLCLPNDPNAIGEVVKELNLSSSKVKMWLITEQMSSRSNILTWIGVAVCVPVAVGLVFVTLSHTVSGLVTVAAGPTVTGLVLSFLNSSSGFAHLMVEPYAVKILGSNSAMSALGATLFATTAFMFLALLFYSSRLRLSTVTLNTTLDVIKALPGVVAIPSIAALVVGFVALSALSAWGPLIVDRSESLTAPINVPHAKQWRRLQVQDEARFDPQSYSPRLEEDHAGEADKSNYLDLDHHISGRGGMELHPEGHHLPPYYAVHSDNDQYRQSQDSNQYPQAQGDLDTNNFPLAQIETNRYSQEPMDPKSSRNPQGQIDSNANRYPQGPMDPDANRYREFRPIEEVQPLQGDSQNQGVMLQGGGSHHDSGEGINPEDWAVRNPEESPVPPLDHSVPDAKAPPLARVDPLPPLKEAEPYEVPPPYEAPQPFEVPPLNSRVKDVTADSADAEPRYPIPPNNTSHVESDRIWASLPLSQRVSFQVSCFSLFRVLCFVTSALFLAEASLAVTQFLVAAWCCVWYFSVPDLAGRRDISPSDIRTATNRVFSSHLGSVALVAALNVCLRFVKMPVFLASFCPPLIRLKKRMEDSNSKFAKLANILSVSLESVSETTISECLLEGTDLMTAAQSVVRRHHKDKAVTRLLKFGGTLASIGIVWSVTPIAGITVLFVIKQFPIFSDLYSPMFVCSPQIVAVVAMTVAYYVLCAFAISISQATETIISCYRLERQDKSNSLICTPDQLNITASEIQSAAMRMIMEEGETDPDTASSFLLSNQTEDPQSTAAPYMAMRPPVSISKPVTSSSQEEVPTAASLGTGDASTSFLTRSPWVENPAIQPVPPPGEDVIAELQRISADGGLRIS
eukprot:Gregarina_sp_Poly_1__5118@NODE_270_length_10308_cov_216_811151_g235_i0_p1_GENE_NODE_270_length_10308_cov_216_811151_g235_i0NODE_270_length_10308_cov_216_811151_g235_i0_p1_ORF_typecomplete_len1021_score140_51Choline_transpo/PF04515_12/2_1e03Choline_transpo/PF04515_12/1e03Choline_transpo/PF04515_12/0_0094Choline_transpo/PF04515_12/1_1e14_NODE_270_length_10308_cov_216_811151_g235_i037766838